MENFSSLHSVCIKVFESIASATSIFILPLFLGKVVFSNIMGEGSKAFVVLKGAFVYFFLIAAFPLIIESLFAIPETYLPKFSALSSFVESSHDWNLASIPFSLDRILEVILAGLYWLVYYLHVFFMLLMCSMAPLVFLLSTLLGVGIGLEIFMGLLLIGSSWPLIWYGFDQVHASLVSAQSDEFGKRCLELLITLFKGLAPVSFASLAVKSPAGKAINHAAQGAIAIAKWTAGPGSSKSTVTTPIGDSRQKINANNFQRVRKQESEHQRTAATLKTNRLCKDQFSKPTKGLRQNENTPPRNTEA